MVESSVEYILTLSPVEIGLLKEVMDYEIQLAHEEIANGYDDAEQEEWRDYLKLLIAVVRKMDSIEGVCKKPALPIDPSIEVLHPEFLEIN